MYKGCKIDDKLSTFPYTKSPKPDRRLAGELPVEKEVDDYITFFNEQRPAYALSYLTPKQYRESFSATLSV